MSEEEKKDVLNQLNDSFNDFVKNVFGEKAAKNIEDTGKQLQDFSAKAIKGFVEFGDQVMDSLKLNENELVKKSSDQVKDLLKQTGLLKEDSEEKF
ncbi:MAG: hypothetical protein GF364_19810 [Candidatus Lokiarchaeota archaeon]|nr:hypothetical protein [Candidatus Lokiarchaeota archaeon]